MAANFCRITHIKDHESTNERIEEMKQIFKPIAKYRQKNVMRLWGEDHLKINLESEYKYNKLDINNWELGDSTSCENEGEYKAKKAAIK